MDQLQKLAAQLRKFQTEKEAGPVGKQNNHTSQQQQQNHTNYAQYNPRAPPIQSSQFQQKQVAQYPQSTYPPNPNNYGAVNRMPLQPQNSIYQANTNNRSDSASRQYNSQGNYAATPQMSYTAPNTYSQGSRYSQNTSFAMPDQGLPVPNFSQYESTYGYRPPYMPAPPHQPPHTQAGSGIHAPQYHPHPNAPPHFQQVNYRIHQDNIPNRAQLPQYSNQHQPTQYNRAPQPPLTQPVANPLPIMSFSINTSATNRNPSIEEHFPLSMAHIVISALMSDRDVTPQLIRQISVPPVKCSIVNTRNYGNVPSKALARGKVRNEDVVFTVSGPPKRVAEILSDLWYQHCDNVNAAALSNGRKGTYNPDIPLGLPPLRLLVPHSAIGPLMGKGGSRIKELQEATKLRIGAEDNVSGTEVRVVSIVSLYGRTKEQNPKSAESTVSDIKQESEQHTTSALVNQEQAIKKIEEGMSAEVMPIAHPYLDSYESNILPPGVGDSEDDSADEEQPLKLPSATEDLSSPSVSQSKGMKLPTTLVTQTTLLKIRVETNGDNKAPLDLGPPATKAEPRTWGAVSTDQTYENLLQSSAPPVTSASDSDKAMKPSEHVNPSAHTSTDNKSNGKSVSFANAIVTSEAFEPRQAVLQREKSRVYDALYDISLVIMTPGCPPNDIKGDKKRKRSDVDHDEQHNQGRSAYIRNKHSHEHPVSPDSADNSSIDQRISGSLTTKNTVKSPNDDVSSMPPPFRFGISDTMDPPPPPVPHGIKSRTDFFIPRGLVGFLIGPKGQKITEARQATQASILIMEKGDSRSHDVKYSWRQGETLVSVIGQLDQVNSAVRMLTQWLWTAPLAERISANRNLQRMNAKE